MTRTYFSQHPSVAGTPMRRAGAWPAAESQRDRTRAEAGPKRNRSGTASCSAPLAAACGDSAAEIDRA
ncbi:hypothetical protein BURMUCF2_3158 [Burkholderia multivorans CF2]|nr:hypothetical protein BURMUCF2_3158 [Burkholderia multivorans CF2]